MPYIDQILTEPKQSQYIPILTGLAAPHTNTFNISILIPSISTPKHTARCLKITGNGSKSLKNLKLRNKNSKLTQAAQLSERKAHVWMKFRRQGSIFPIYVAESSRNQESGGKPLLLETKLNGCASTRAFVCRIARPHTLIGC